MRLTRHLQTACCAVTAVLLLTTARVAGGQGGDSTFLRVQRLVNAGDRTGARVFADSVLIGTSPATPAYADALYARAFASSNAADAERDYLRVSIEYPLSPRADDATLMVAQLKLARGDRSGARRQFERLVREHPGSPQVSKSSFWAGRLALESGDATRGCASLVLAKSQLPAAEIELDNQIDYYLARCSAASLARGGVDSVPNDSATRPRTRLGKPAPIPVIPRGGRPQYSIQVASFSKKRDADALADVLGQRGFKVRVFGTRTPFRVRVGRYDLRDEAVAALARMKTSRVKGIIVDAEAK